MIEKISKMHPSSIGFLQALGVALYCLVVSGLLNSFQSGQTLPQFWGLAIFLLLFVVSATITGLLVLGYPGYLIFKHKIKRALSVFAYTLAFAVLIILIAMFVFAS